jgi:hypothetical protein
LEVIGALEEPTNFAIDLVELDKIVEEGLKK